MECDRDCSGCCNKTTYPSGTFDDLGHGLSYEMVMITGGEPLKFPLQLFNLISQMKRYRWQVPIFLYTAIKTTQKSDFMQLMFILDGITFTIHDKRGWEDFMVIDSWLKTKTKPFTKRLNIFRNAPIAETPYILSLYDWDVKFITWVENCPLPKDEVFLKLPKLFTSE
jgi:hypothetical protein